MHSRRTPTSGLILGIETSCDETAAAVVRRGTDTVSNIVASQMALHANYGGVVPELASREHLRNIVLVVREALARAQVTFTDLDAIAVTSGPGLAGALLVGITYAKALAFGINKPLIAINHLEGHIQAVLMEGAGTLQAQSLTDSGSSLSTAATFGGSGFLPQADQRPLLALVVSGGHTNLYLANQESVERGGARLWRYRNVGRTVDDAAGEAFDKVAKLLGLGYPGGPWIDFLAPYGDPSAVRFTFAQIRDRAQNLAPEMPDAIKIAGGGAPSRSSAGGQISGQIASGISYDFSFSGIKTAVLRYTQAQSMQASVEDRRCRLASDPTRKPADSLALFDQQSLDLIASFQHAVVGSLLRQSFAAAEVFGCSGLIVSGGVAANSELRRRFIAEADRRGVPVAFPSLALSTDNAAMIAAAAWPHLLVSDFAAEDLTASPGLRLG